MSYKVLYRTYRPLLFKDVVGQDYIVKTLKNAIKKVHQLMHFYFLLNYFYSLLEIQDMINGKITKPKTIIAMAYQLTPTI